MRAIAIEANHDRAEKQAEICRTADAVDDGDGVVVVTDLFGGSPSNLSLMACSVRNRAILYGANLPMLVKLAKSRHLPVSDAVAAARDAGRRYINSFELAPDDPAPAAAAPPRDRPAQPSPLAPCAVQPIRAPARSPRARRRPGIGKSAT